LFYYLFKQTIKLIFRGTEEENNLGVLYIQ